MLAVLVEIPPGDEADGGADFALAGKANYQYGVGNTDGVRVSERNERAEAIGFQKGDSRAGVAGHDLGGQGASAEIHGYILGFEDDSSVGVNGSGGIDKKHSINFFNIHTNSNI